MAEPSTTTATALTTAGIGLAAMLPAVDGNALIGAFAGATLFVVQARELALWTRAIYLVISLIMGYMAAGELTHHLPITETGVTGFIAGLFCIAVSAPLVARLETLDLISIIKGRLK